MFEIDISTFDPGAGGDRSTSFAVRRLFGDWVLLAGLCVVAVGGTAGLMALVRLFWSLPISREQVESEKIASQGAAASVIEHLGIESRPEVDHSPDDSL